ncbi:MAG: DUF5777 family beta-barrel protein, partial [Ferruginibacter sp.]
MTKLTIAFFVCSVLCSVKVQSQDLLKGVEDSVPATQKITGAFKSTRVINAHSIEMLHKGDLDFRIMHRFGFISSGIKQLYGLDAASMRISFDYGLSDNTTIGLGRSTFRKELDLFIKQRLLQQSTGAKLIPFSLVLAAGGLVWTEESFAP